MTETLHTPRFLNASECNAQRRISLPLLIQQLIDAATCHSTELGVSPADLQARSLAWVLSRLTIDIDSFPAINTGYAIDTWVSSINRHFTERCFAITGPNGRALGYARSVWIAIDLTTRRSGDLSAIMGHVPIVDAPCPVISGGKLQAVAEPDLVRTHRFAYCDIDFNRHVNSCRYIEAILNDHDVDFYDTHSIKRFEIAYMDEIHYNDLVEIRRSTLGPACSYEITRDGSPVTRARITFK